MEQFFSLQKVGSAKSDIGLGFYWKLESIENYTQDYNFDGVADVYYEYYTHSYVQFADRNFDGKADEKYEFDINTDFLLDGRLDNNFDGVFETQLVIFQGVIQYEFVDSNNNKLIDVVSSYEHGVLKKMHRYVQDREKKLKQIEVHQFEFGVPQGKVISVTKLNAREFHQEQTKKIRIQRMYKSESDT